jgi:hypothetical protein
MNCFMISENEYRIKEKKNHGGTEGTKGHREKINSLNLLIFNIALGYLCQTTKALCSHSKD